MGGPSVSWIWAVSEKSNGDGVAVRGQGVGGSGIPLALRLKTTACSCHLLRFWALCIQFWWEGWYPDMLGAFAGYVPRMTNGRPIKGIGGRKH